MKKIVFISCFLLVMVSFINAQQTDFPILTGPCLGQKPPGMTPEIFAPEIITAAPHSVAVFSPDGREMYWVPWSTLKMQTMKQVDGVWQKSQTVPFAAEYDAENPWFSMDGSRMYFTSTRPLPIGKPNATKKFWNENIWYVDRKGDGWSEPVPLGPEVNSMDLHWQFSMDASNQDLYFSASTGEEGGGSDIYTSVLLDGKYTAPVKLGETVNTTGDEDTPFVASNGSYLIFARKPGAGTFSDLYISFRNRNGFWTDAIPLGKSINSEEHEVYPRVTGDGKCLFFIGIRAREPKMYWVDAKIIEELRPKE